MLIRFSVENFRSFNKRVVFSMLPGKGTLKTEHKNNPVKEVSVLKTSIVLGANASGKSNLIKAIALGKKMILSGNLTDTLKEYDKFRLDNESLNTNSRLEYELQHNGKNYAYGFIFNSNIIVEEWLYEITKKSEKLIFKRENSIFDISPLLAKNKKEEHKQFLNFTAKGTPDNQLFLKEIFSRKVINNVDNIDDLSNVYNWFKNSLKIIFPDDKYNEGIKSEIVNNDVLQRVYEELLKYFGTGIDGICLKEIDIRNTEIPQKIIENIKQSLFDKGESSRTILTTPFNTYFITLNGAELSTQKFMTKHNVINGSDPAFFDTKDESDGTNRIIDYIPVIIDLLKGDKVFIIDEMERSLHPNLIHDLFDLYLSESNEKASQLIVATHESSLLNQKLLRKDEIWFMVKDQLGASNLNSLEDYNVRFDKDIRKDYLLGRYKAVPRLGSRYKLTALDKLKNEKK